MWNFIRFKLISLLISKEELYIINIQNEFHYINYILLIQEKLFKDKKYIESNFIKGSISQKKKIDKINELLIIINGLYSCYINKDFQNYKKLSSQFFIRFNRYYINLY